jgi:hypothetical protein
LEFTLVCVLPAKRSCSSVGQRLEPLPMTRLMTLS